ncbi:MAG: hypothetical protein GX786_07990 [Clostridiales bacterium]|nr:hypothetical protein [Clostridiales bacterium]
MNTEVILAKIEEEARKSAAAILSEAKEKATRAKKASEEKIHEQKEAMLEKATEEGNALEERMIRMAQLDQGKEFLGLKQKLMNDTFQQALTQLHTLPDERLAEFFLNLVCQTAQGTERVVVGANQNQWFDKSFIEKANQRCISQNKPGQLTLEENLFPNETGIVLRGQGTLVHCTLEALLSTQRTELEADIAAILFS